MGFPAGDLSSGLVGFFEGFCRNHMEEVIKFSKHITRFALSCISEAHWSACFVTYLTSILSAQGRHKVYNLCQKGCKFPFNDHNCPPLQLIKSFCQSAYSWLKEDIENVVVVHCKAGMGRTGLMIYSLLLFLKLKRTSTTSTGKRCIDGRALVLPSQIPEDLWIRTPKKGIVIFALPRGTGLAELTRDFKIHFHNPRGDFYWSIGSPYPGFKIDLVMIDYEGTVETNSKANFANKGTEGDSGFAKGGVSANLNQSKPSGSRNNDNIFSWRQKPDSSWCRNRTYGNNGVDKASSGLQIPITESMGASDIKAMSADASSSVLEMKKILKVNDPSFFTNYDKI
ncbi:hypothetical protein PVK06_039474 [Gossypium arboreum]|uniref:Phosphatidylinositol 3,4,5-trisphosphate 3-phosphatase and protein-tyrosine-phosphatase PTEN2A-like n=1 Tax=Gossypium arboreum TaxID=29729 RepID=A0ABR0N3P8_GOSAR|nr:hypothetical protein PVK06_039474 [Gossypium arboreum]